MYIPVSMHIYMLLYSYMNETEYTFRYTDPNFRFESGAPHPPVSLVKATCECKQTAIGRRESLFQRFNAYLFSS